MTRTSRTGANRGDVGPEDERTGTMPAGRTTSSTDGDERREGVGPVSGRRMRCRVVALAVLGLATMVVGLLTAAPASAHAQLLGSDPKADSTVGAPLTEITLLFNDLVRGDYSTVVLTGPDGRRHGAGQPRAVDKRVHLPISPLRSGGYRVAYRVVSADGHPIEGQFRFTVALAPGQEPTPSATATTPPASPAAAATGTTGKAGSVTPLWWAGAVVVGTALVAAGVALVRRQRRRPIR
ncbi:copper resistance CopC family protein [Plantactinospora soyae]|uniref:Methionine-rich copper-binding protein CopC n=1 Tax=Plantactinospora soyae TaxID=1544732 RepID=A0A927QYK5_9ACTN|nr:copper resistance CopC family protein [Plantactinospora soyae]MBE1489330.1 methionine-rich copper-binding protein CopC [Plantactinospora soyae]